MKLFDKYRQNSANEEEKAAMTELFIQQKYDKELKDKMKKRLERDHGITRNRSQQGTALRRKMVVRWVSSIAAAVLIGLAIWQVASPRLNYQNMADEMLTAYIPSNEMRKGAGDFSEERGEAIIAYNRQDFERSAQLRELIAKGGAATEEDFFYLGVSFLSQEQVQVAPAIEALQNALNIPQGQLRQEAQWYLSLAYLKADRIADARSLLERIVNENEWKASSAARLLEVLPSEK